MKLKKWLAPMVFTLVILLIVWLALSENSPVRVNGIRNNTSRWETGWQAETPDGDVYGLALPARLKLGDTVLLKPLPATIPPGYCVYIKSNNQKLTATVNGNPLAVLGLSDAPGYGLPFDLPWSVIRLTPDLAGQTLRIQCSGTGSKVFVEVYSVRLGTAAEVQLALLDDSMPTMVLSLLILLFAMVVFTFALMQARHYHERVSIGYAYLLLFVVCSGAWFFTDTDIAGVAYVGSRAYLLINIFTYLLLPLPFLLFTRKAQLGCRRMAFTLLCLIALNVLIQATLMLAGRFVMWLAISFSHAMLIACCLMMIAITRQRGPNRTFTDELRVGLTITAVSGLITCLLFYLIPLEDNSAIFRIGALGLVVTVTISFLRTNVDLLTQTKTIEQLRIHEEEYRIAARQSDKFVQRFDVAKRTLFQANENASLFGMEQDTPNMPEAAIAAGLVAEESIADFREFYTDMLLGKPEGSCTASLRSADGQFSWYHGDYTMIFSADHQPLQAVISFYDISAQRERELAFQKWKQSYAEIPASSMNYYEYNLTRDTLTGESGHLLPPLPEDAKQSLQAVVDHLTQRYVSSMDEQRFSAFFQRKRLLEAYEHGIRSDQLEFRRLDSDRRPLWTLATVQLIADPYSNDVQAFLLLRDEDARKRDEMNVRARSNTDSMTGLLNRAAFEEQIGALLEHTLPDGVHALLMIDLDGFKRVNDVFGHQFGDRVLTEIAGTLRTMMRGDDLIGRIGGDEYMVCLKNVRDNTGFLEKRSARICQALNRQFGGDVAISGSVGLALYPHDGQTFEELYHKADKALYYAKHHGKNRFVLYHDDLFGGDTNAPSSSAPFAKPVDVDVVAQAEAHPMRTLLIVDDVEMNREILREIFKNDYHLLIAQSGQECLELMGNSEPVISAVLLDLIMPDIDGLEVLRRVQKDAYMASIPVIVISAAEETEYSLKAIELGANDFVSKPIDPRLVRLRVQNAIHKRETEELRAQNRYLLVQKSDENRHQTELRQQAEHDALTGIFNKAAFYQKTRAMLDQTPDVQYVMIAFDVEKFRIINDIFGREEGDRLLCRIADGLYSLFSNRAVFGRVDADNFVLCLPYNQKELQAVFQHVEKSLHEYDLPFDIMLTFGLNVMDDSTAPLSTQHDRAEMAKRTVKGQYVKRYAYYDDALRQALQREMDIVNNMTAALALEQFEIYLQPKCMLQTGEIVGAEALVRWNHPTRGVLLPGEFVPVFEKNGFILKLDAYVWERVCALIRRWMDTYGGLNPCPISMNVSRVNLYNPALVTSLCSLVDRYGVPRRLMELEITESAYAMDPRQLSGLVSELHAQGFPVEMDDFGSAYSSLNMLKEISVDLLKLDMRFLYGNDEDGRGGTILSSIVRMARYLSLPIIAEGVETEEQARFLSSIGCMVAQGFYYYKPMPIADFERLLAKQAKQAPVGLHEHFPEASIRRVWSIDGDFSLILNSIPCAASLVEMNGDNLELLRINDEYLRMTKDSTERIYRYGTNVRHFATNENFLTLLRLFQRALANKDIAEDVYRRVNEHSVEQQLQVRVKYLTGDETHALFFVTYQLLSEGGTTA